MVYVFTKALIYDLVCAVFAVDCHVKNISIA